ncbi:MAG TPA: HEAT repeat domain-containing protein [Acidobacteriaceae bacterium]|nr:HEAT repeat domain-containing protein [Acidobacteriaceae bacterium]
MHASRKLVTLAVLFPFVFTSARSSAQKVVTHADAMIVGSNTPVQEAEEPEVKAASASVESAWNMLATATHKAVVTRISAMAALGTMGSDARAAKMIREGMNDPDMEVRTAAILAAGQTKNRALLPALRERLKDSEPQIVFTAAATMWKMGDRSGEEVLKAVADGDRKATPGLMHGAKNDVNHELHHPGELAMMGATDGASLLLGPFGFGIRAVEYMRKSGGDASRAAAINLLAESHARGIDAELMDALDDKDAAVRAAAAKALGQRHDAAAVKSLGELFSDPKLPVRLTAAAAYINCARGARVRT